MQTTEQSGVRHKTPACVCKVQQGYKSGFVFPSCCAECPELCSPARFILCVISLLTVDSCATPWEACWCKGCACGELILVLWLGHYPSLAPALDQAIQLTGIYMAPQHWCPTCFQVSAILMSSDALLVFFSSPQRAGLVAANQSRGNNKSEGLWPTKTTGTHLRKDVQRYK